MFPCNMRNKKLFFSPSGSQRGCGSEHAQSTDRYHGDIWQRSGVRRSRQLLDPKRVQRLLLLCSDPQHGAAGAPVRRGAHRARTRLHVLPGEYAPPLHTLSTAHTQRWWGWLLTGSSDWSDTTVWLFFSVLRSQRVIVLMMSHVPTNDGEETKEFRSSTNQT